MSDEPIKQIIGRPGDPQFEALTVLIEAMRAAVAPIMDQSFEDPRDAMSVLMTSAATFSGIQAGTLMAIGAFTQQDSRRLGEAALVNFRQGIKFGLQRAQRFEAEMAGRTTPH